MVNDGETQGLPTTVLLTEESKDGCSWTGVYPGIGRPSRPSAIRCDDIFGAVPGADIASVAAGCTASLVPFHHLPLPLPSSGPYSAWFRLLLADAHSSGDVLLWS